MVPDIVESYTQCGVNAGRIVRRIIRHIPVNVLDDLKTIKLLDNHPSRIGFARYCKDKAEIEIYISEIVEWQPWLLKKTFVFPYLTIGLALGHEIDHHVNRYNNDIDKERSAEINALKYVYPSMGLFKPIVKIIFFLARRLKHGRCYEEQHRGSP